MIILEIIVIIVVVALQLRVFLQNRQQAAALRNFFPEKSQLYMQAAEQAGATPTGKPLTAILEGTPYVLAAEPNHTFRVKGRDGEFYVIEETALDTSTATTYLLSRQELEEQSGKPGLKLMAEAQQRTQYSLAEVPAAHQPSEAFAVLLQEVQAYLLRNQGTVTGLNTIKDMSERRLEAETGNLQVTVATPLYIGLLGTFLGVILGLGAVVTGGVTEEAIERFLLGVVVAMLGSFFGLLFTLLGNREYRLASGIASVRLNDWLNFLQIQLLPRLQSDLSQSLGNLKVVLDEFNKDFFQRISDFKSVFANLNQYVGLQERFLVALQQTDYSQLTEANLRFFEQIQKNESIFERFGQYLQRLNESMDTGREAASDIREIVEHLRQLDDVQGYLKQNEELIRKQLGYLSAHQDKMEQLTYGIQQHFIEAGDEIGALVKQRLQIMKKEEQDAGEELRQHFERLKQDNVYQKITEQLQPIRNMEDDVQSMRELFADTLKHLLETQQYLIRKINQDGQTQGRVLKEMELLNNHMQQLNERKSWMHRMFGGR
ncbi:hypothetical protein D770_24285 [Flammeovirgaceae bacterium 311]|nr:hypothetical protein D770_24285 [Flammeovirgaceae bacterium 311]